MHWCCPLGWPFTVINKQDRSLCCLPNPNARAAPTGAGVRVTMAPTVNCGPYLIYSPLPYFWAGYTHKYCKSWFISTLNRMVSKNRVLETVNIGGREVEGREKRKLHPLLKPCTAVGILWLCCLASVARCYSYSTALYMYYWLTDMRYVNEWL